MTGNEDKLTATVLTASQGTVDTAVATLEALQFDVQKIIGGSLVISASRQVFSEAFQYDVAVNDDHQAFFLVEGNAMYELPQTRIPSHLADVCAAVELHRPPEFGPGSFE